MQTVLFMVVLAITSAWIVIGISLTSDEGFLVTVTVVFGGALVLRGIFWLVLRAFPQLRGDQDSPRSG